MEIFNEFSHTIQSLINETGFLSLSWQNYVMIAISAILIYLAIAKKFEPLLLLPIAFGMLLVNLYPPIMGTPSTNLQLVSQYITEHGATANYPTVILEGQEYYQVPTNGGLLYYLYQGVKLGIFPPLIFLGIGTMTDFGPLISNPKSFLLGAAAQLGIFITFIGAILLKFEPTQAGSIAIIGGADGPTAIFVTSKLAPELLGPIAVAAYSYMALVPIIQPPIMKALTTEKERSVVMEQLRPVSKLEKILFPIIVTLIVALILPDSTPLIGMLMLGNLFRESGVVSRLSNTLVVSGGHTHLVRVKDYGKFDIIGRTRDDAAGEAFDKVARAIGLGYPGGPKIDKVSKEGNPNAIPFPRAHIEDAPYDFSFSGVKSAVLNYINGCKMKDEEFKQADIAASFQKAVTDVLVANAMHAVEEYQVDKFAIAGGVASNSALRAAMKEACETRGVRFYYPSPIYCTDNAAMIGVAAYYEYMNGARSGWDLNAVPNLKLGER